MKIIIPGGSGQVGSILSRAFAADGDEVVILSRRPDSTAVKTLRETASQSRYRSVRVVGWDGRSMGPWVDELDGADVVINLAGRSVNCRYHDANRRAILDSRLHSTQAVGQAISRANAPPAVWLQASTATVYAHRFDQPNDETTGVLGGAETNAPANWRFSIDVAKTWEAAAASFQLPATRQVLMRSAMTMSPDRGGVFDYLLALVRFGLGGKQGNGHQFVSWIHAQDFYRAIRWIIGHEQLSGPVNLASPCPLPNAEFMRDLRRAWGTKLGLPATRWMLEIGTFLLRSETELILKSRRVIPRRLVESGFEFQFPTWREAARDLCKSWWTQAKPAGSHYTTRSGPQPRAEHVAS